MMTIKFIIMFMVAGIPALHSQSILTGKTENKCKGDWANFTYTVDNLTQTQADAISAKNFTITNHNNGEGIFRGFKPLRAYTSHWRALFNIKDNERGLYSAIYTITIPNVTTGDEIKTRLEVDLGDKGVLSSVPWVPFRVTACEEPARKGGTDGNQIEEKTGQTTSGPGPSHAVPSEGGADSKDTDLLIAIVVMVAFIIIILLALITYYLYRKLQQSISGQDSVGNKKSSSTPDATAGNEDGMDAGRSTTSGRDPTPVGQADGAQMGSAGPLDPDTLEMSVLLSV